MRFRDGSVNQTSIPFFWHFLWFYGCFSIFTITHLKIFILFFFKPVGATGVFQSFQIDLELTTFLILYTVTQSRMS